MKDFSTFLDMSRYKNWAHKISYWEYLTIWKSALPVFPWAQSTSFPLSTLNSFRECWKSEAAAAHDLILVEVDGKQSWQVPICGWQYACMCTKLLPLCLTLCDTMDCSPPHSSVHGILQARILDWVTIPSSRGYSRPRIEPISLTSPALTGGFFTTSAIWES